MHRKLCGLFVFQNILLNFAIMKRLQIILSTFLLLACTITAVQVQAKTPEEYKNAEKSLKKESGCKEVLFLGDFFILRDGKTTYSPYKIGTLNGKLLPGKWSGTGKYDLIKKLYDKKYLWIAIDGPLYDLDGNVVLEHRPWDISELDLDGEKLLWAFIYRNNRKVNYIYDRDFNLKLSFEGEDFELVKLGGRSFWLDSKKLCAATGETIMDCTEKKNVNLSVKNGTLYSTKEIDSHNKIVSKWEYLPADSTFRAVLNPEMPHITFCGKDYYFKEWGAGLYDLEGNQISSANHIDEMYISDAPDYAGSYMLFGSCFVDQNFKNIYCGHSLTPLHFDDLTLFLDITKISDNHRDCYYYDNCAIIDINGKRYPIEPELTGDDYTTFYDQWYATPPLKKYFHNPLNPNDLKIENGVLKVRNRNGQFKAVPGATVADMRYNPIWHDDKPKYDGILLKR